jgi:hypothetical protein
MNSFSIHFHQLCGFPAQVKEPEPPEEVQLLKKIMLRYSSNIVKLHGQDPCIICMDERQ